MGIDDVGNFIEKGSTFLDGGLFPRGKSFPRGIYRSDDISRRSFGTARELVACSRTERIERFAIRSWLPLMKRPYSLLSFASGIMEIPPMYWCKLFFIS